MMIIKYESDSSWNHLDFILRSTTSHRSTPVITTPYRYPNPFLFSFQPKNISQTLAPNKNYNTSTSHMNNHQRDRKTTSTVGRANKFQNGAEFCQNLPKSPTRIADDPTHMSRPSNVSPVASLNDCSSMIVKNSPESQNSTPSVAGSAQISPTHQPRHADSPYRPDRTTTTAPMLPHVCRVMGAIDNHPEFQDCVAHDQEPMPLTPDPSKIHLEVSKNHSPTNPNHFQQKINNSKPYLPQPQETLKPTPSMSANPNKRSYSTPATSHHITNPNTLPIYENYNSAPAFSRYYKSVPNLSRPYDFIPPPPKEYLSSKLLWNGTKYGLNMNACADFDKVSCAIIKNLQSQDSWAETDSYLSQKLHTLAYNAYSIGEYEMYRQQLNRCRAEYLEMEMAREQWIRARVRYLAPYLEYLSTGALPITSDAIPTHTVDTISLDMVHE